MAVLTFKSPGVSTREIDLSGPTALTPVGVPAGVVGTAVRGPAFVPITVATFQDFISKFGNTDGEKFGPLAMNEWLRNANAGTYVRLLGVGDAKKRTSSGNNAGRVNRAGFVVGSEQVQGNGFVGRNPNAFNRDNTEARATFRVAAHPLVDGDRLNFNVPIAAGGEGPGGDLLFAGNVGGPGNNRIRLQFAGRLAFTDEDIAQLIVFAINGTVPSGAAPSGVGDFIAADIHFANGGTIGESGIQGITATRSGTDVIIQADQVGVDGTTIVFTDANNDPVTQGFGQSPATLVGTKAHAEGTLGRTYFLGHFASSSNSYFTEAGIISRDAEDHRARAILRGVVMTPSGVHATLNTIAIGDENNVPSLFTRLPAGSPFGDILTGSAKQEFVMILNGHKESDTSVRALTASFDRYAPNYFSKVFNTDPSKIEEMGHYLYADYQVSRQDLVLTGAGVTNGPDHIPSRAVRTAFLLSGAIGPNEGLAPTAGHIGAPSFENFEDRYRTACSPYVISQKFGGANKNIFKVHALDDGRAGSDAIKITIQNIQASTNENDPYGKFDLSVRFFADTDAEPVVLETFAGLDLNPSSDNYIARRIGDTHTFYDFDKSSASQKLVIDGVYPNVSNYIRVEMSPEAHDGVLNDTAIPVGFRGLNHLTLSGSIHTDREAPLSGSESSAFAGVFAVTASIAERDLHIVQPPVPMRKTLSVGVGTTKRVDSSLTWGIQFEHVGTTKEPNKFQAPNPSIRSFIRYFPDFHTVYPSPSVGGNEGTPDVGGSILDADRHNNNMFTLERVQVITGSGNKPDVKQWASAVYRRDGVASAELNDIDGVATSKTRLLDTGLDFAHLPSRKFLKFTFPLQGGFDGVNIFDRDKSNFADPALRREMDDATNQGGSSGPTVAAYRKGIEVMEEKSDVDIQLLAVPGVRHESVTDFAIDSVEKRFDAMYVMDIEERDTLNAPITGSNSIINVKNTVDRHATRNFDTSFAAAYFPDVVIQDPATKTNVQCPPSVAVLGAFAFNDAVAHPWFAPAGFNRGSLSSTLESQVKLNRDNLDSLYEVDINPITSFPSTPGVVIFGQKTLMAASSALDRVNVRRLLIDVRRQVKNVANTLLFEQNREATLSKFSNAVNPILARIQQQQGLDRFRVQIDTTTTTQADVENNTIRGKIFLQPTKSVEFISLDFVVTNAGADVG